MNRTFLESPLFDALPETLKAVLRELSEAEKALILCNDQLYDGDWDAMVHDLVSRLEGKPFVFKLGQRIVEDIERVKRLRSIETQYKIILSDYITI